MLQKAKNFEQAKGIFNTFMERLEQQEEENKTKLKVGEIYLNELLPPTVLDELAEAGEGHAIEYKLVLVNAAGAVFQVLPFKVVYK